MEIRYVSLANCGPGGHSVASQLLTSERLPHEMTATSPDKARPILRWAGSKRKLLNRLQPFWDSDKYDRYVEPFAGSACLFFAIQPGRALLADKNHELIEMYEVVRENPEQLFEVMINIPRTKQSYYAERSRNPRHLSHFDRAVRFLYLNRNCFNGIFRTNRDGHFNVPFATSRAGRYFTRAELVKCAELLEFAELRTWDFGTTLRYVTDSDFVYIDPPFAVSSRRIFREYGPTTFGVRDIERLQQHLQKLDQRGADFLVSYADCKEARQLACGWTSRRVRVRRHVAGFAASRKRSYELLITNIDETRTIDGD